MLMNKESGRGVLLPGAPNFVSWILKSILKHRAI